MKNISIQNNPSHFFKTAIEEALKNQKVETAAEVEFYLVNMLSHFMQTEHLYQKTEKGLDFEPLAIKLYKALQARTARKIQLLREMGDISLYVSGFFGESLNQSLVNVEYYMGMGGTAYKNLSCLMPEKVFQDVFNELATKFSNFVEILAEVSHMSHIRSHTSILQIYEKWLKTKSERLFKLLQEEGIIPIDPSTNTHKKQ